MVLKRLGEAIGLPDVADVKEVLQNLPDEKRLRLVRDIVSTVERLKAGEGELQAVFGMVSIIATVEPERLESVKEITNNLVKITKALPPDFLANLPIKEIAEEIKAELKKKGTLT